GIDTNITYSNQSNLVVERVTLYPIKSCHGFTIPPSSSWPVTSQGLLYDREWMLVNLRTGKALSQKIFPRMTLIRPVVFRDKELLVISAPGHDPLQIKLNEYPDDIDSSTTCSSQVCGDKIETFIYTSPHITNWFTNFLGIPCRLARQPPITNNDNNFIQSQRFIKPHLDVPLTNAHLSLSNESPFLLISRNSVNHVNEMILENENKDETIVEDCFRANILIKATCEYEEDEWKMIRIGGQVFRLIGPCRRCHMICINHETAEKIKEPYSTLAKYRRFKGKIFFGQHMIHDAELSDSPFEIKSGAKLEILEKFQDQQEIFRKPYQKIKPHDGRSDGRNDGRGDGGRGGDGRSDAEETGSMLCESTDVVYFGVVLKSTFIIVNKYDDNDTKTSTPRWTTPTILGSVAGAHRYFFCR
ncbi:23864_t:CDS:10, partial [Dentiscutata erythropus]